MNPSQRLTICRKEIEKVVCIWWKTTSWIQRWWLFFSLHLLSSFFFLNFWIYCKTPPGEHKWLWLHKKPPLHSLLLPYRDCMYKRVKMIITLRTAREWEGEHHTCVQANILSAKGLCWLMATAFTSKSAISIIGSWIRWRPLALNSLLRTKMSN